MAWNSDADIAGVFAEFGYTPTEAEINALRPSFAEGMGDASTSAVGQYVNYKNEIAQFNANDPLTGIQNQMKDLITQNQASVTGLSAQLQSTLSAAPQLFGSLTPDQISAYLAPLQTSFTQQLSQVQATMASRGLGASSTEANALAQAGQQFQQTVLSTGLNIGLTSQQNQATALQTQINNLFGQTNTAMGLQTTAAQQQSQQNLGESNLIASLPAFLNSNAQQTAAFEKAFNPDTGGFQNLFNQVTGDINQGTNTATNLLGKQGLEGIFGGTAPTQMPTTTPGSSLTTPSAASTSMGGANYASPNLSLLQGNSASTAAEQYGYGFRGIKHKPFRFRITFRIGGIMADPTLFGEATEASAAASQSLQQGNEIAQKDRSDSMKAGTDAGQQNLEYMKLKLDRAQNIIDITPQIALGLVKNTGDKEWLKSVGQSLPAPVYSALYTQGMKDKISGKVFKAQEGNDEISFTMAQDDNGEFQPQIIGRGPKFSPTASGEITPEAAAKNKIEKEKADAAKKRADAAKTGADKKTSDDSNKEADKWFKSANDARKQIQDTFTKKGGMPKSGLAHDIISKFQGGDPANDARIASLKQNYSDYQTAVENYNDLAEKSGKSPIKIDPSVSSAMDKIMALPGAKGKPDDQAVSDYLKKSNARDTPANRKWAEEQLSGK